MPDNKHEEHYITSYELDFILDSQNDKYTELRKDLREYIEKTHKSEIELNEIRNTLKSNTDQDKEAGKVRKTITDKIQETDMRLSNLETAVDEIRKKQSLVPAGQEKPPDPDDEKELSGKTLFKDSDFLTVIVPVIITSVTTIITTIIGLIR